MEFHLDSSLAPDSSPRRDAQEKINNRLHAPIVGKCKDMTATLPGMEGLGISDMPLFTENKITIKENRK